ncbi:MAG TPA: GHKL domain-containing protein [Firmicutes bacterium]|nr:GHKL domain-containing protein [Bacillota bacterium]
MAEHDQLTALATVGELAATAVHEIKGPLAIADGYIQLLAAQVHDPKQQEICARIRGQLERIDQLVQGLLFLARPQRPHIQTCRPEEVIRNTVNLIGATAAAHGVEIRIEGLQRAPQVMADPAQLTQLLLNLLLNSLEAMPDGGRVKVRLHARHEHLIITVSDTGAGIPFHIRANLFRPFVTSKERGTGLGLAICRHIVERHGGSIRIRTGSSGTTVQVCLPINGPSRTSVEELPVLCAEAALTPNGRGTG